MAVEISASQNAMRAAAAAWSRARIFDDKLGDADAARIAAWAESVERWRLDVSDLLEGVTRFYEGETAGRTIGVGDLLHHARESRRQRAEREKAAEVRSEVTAAAALPRGYSGLPIGAEGAPVWAAYDVHGAIDRECPRCHAEPNGACVTGRGTAQKIPCLERLNAMAHAGAFGGGL
ncbi:hypothetical protein ABZ412_34330 [Nocardia sp. NPDC005746]|uniref:hypothetical protein n=1 Tax=Nocardia sp. NPDC005746 TaxID=3157062 RepID=UPI0033E349BE